MLWLRRFGRTLVLVLAICTAALAVLYWIGSAKDVTNELRAAPTLAVLNGVPIYQIARDQVSFSVLYGPVSYLLQLPAAFFSTPRFFFLAGCLISFSFYCAPLFIFLRSLRAQRENQFRAGLLLWTLFTLITLDSKSLVLSAMLISPDSAALGLAGAACTVLFFYSGKRPWLDPVLMAALICGAVFSKQNMLAIMVILPVFALLIGGRRLAIRLIVCLAGGILATVAIVFLIYHDLWAVYFNNVIVPSRFPRQWDHASHAIRRLYEESELMLFALITLAVIRFAGERFSVDESRRMELYRFLIYPCMMVALIPSSIAGMIFWGGYLNALSPALYFALLTLLALSYLLLTEVRPAAEGRFMVLGVLAVFAAILTPLVAENVDRSWLHAGSPSESVYAYDRQHPGEVYFPFNQVSVFLAEHKFYHADWGIMNFYHAGYLFSPEEIRKHIPPAAHYVAYPPGAPTIAPMASELAPHGRQVKLMGLAGFNIVELER